jgi:hypothetical protein
MSDALLTATEKPWPICISSCSHGKYKLKRKENAPDIGVKIKQ